MGLLIKPHVDTAGRVTGHLTDQDEYRGGTYRYFTYPDGGRRTRDDAPIGPVMLVSPSAERVGIYADVTVEEDGIGIRIDGLIRPEIADNRDVTIAAEWRYIDSRWELTEIIAIPKMDLPVEKQVVAAFYPRTCILDSNPPPIYRHPRC